MAEHSPQVKLRLAQDHERSRLAELDRLDGGDRLYTWTLATFYGQPSLELGVKLPGHVAPAIEGKWDMARAKGSKNKATVASELVEALSFVGMAANKDDLPWQPHVVLHGGYAIAFNGQIAVGHPVTEELTCCPHLARFKAAISKCGKSLNITELESGKLSVKGDKLTALVDCLPLDQYPYTQPDANIAAIDDRLKVAFAVCGVTVSETGDRMVDCTLKLEANQCTATDGKVMLQYWHGIDLPPNLLLPKAFASCVGKMKAPLIGFGFTPGHSVTFHFEGGAWIKTLLYEDKYPDVSPILDRPVTPVPVPPDLFEAIATVGGFNDDGYVMLKDGKVVSHLAETSGAQFAVEGLKSGLMFNSEFIKRVAPVALTVDLTTYEDRAFFFGENVRAVVMGMRPNKEPVGQPVREPEQQYRDSSHDTIRRDEVDDEIPF